MSKSLSLEFHSTLTTTDETIVAFPTKQRYPEGQISQGVDTMFARRVTVILHNKSSVSVTFKIKPGPGKLDPATSERIFVEAAAYTKVVAASSSSIVDISVYHPFYQVTATAASDGSHDVVVYFDAYIDARG